MSATASAQSASPQSDHLKARLRVETIAYEIGKANADKCAAPSVLTGLILHDLASYDATDRARVGQLYHLGDGAGVLDIIPDSPAAAAGIQSGDEIIAVDGMEIAKRFPPDYGKKKTADRVETISAWLDSTLKLASRQLTIRRDGQDLQLSLAPDFGCGGRMAYMPSGPVNAWSDGQYIAVTKAMIDFSRNDDELAFVVAHEMAHNLLNHNAKEHMLPHMAILGLLSRSTYRKEVAADTFATQLLYHTRYNGINAAAMFKRTVLNDLLDLGLSHPLSSQRIATIRKTTAQLEQSDGGLMRAPSDEGAANSLITGRNEKVDDAAQKKAATKFVTAFQ